MNLMSTIEKILFEAKYYLSYMHVSGGSRGGARVTYTPNCGPKGRKTSFFETPPPPPPFSQGLDDRGTPLSEGLDPPLHVVYARFLYKIQWNLVKTTTFG